MITPDEFDKQVEELLACPNCYPEFYSPVEQGIITQHKIACPSKYRPAVAAAGVEEKWGDPVRCTCDSTVRIAPFSAKEEK